MRFSQKQNEYIAMADQRWNFKVGAVRSGKSYVDMAQTIPWRLRSMKDEPGLNVILGVSKSTIERNVLEPMREIFGTSIIGNINSRNIAFICGVPVYCLGAEKITQVAKIQGSSIKYCYGDEVAKWSPEVFEMLKSRLDKPYSCFDGTCNPESPGHWLKGFLDREDLSLYLQKYTIFDNPFLPQGFVEQLCKEYEGTVYYGRYIKGEWTLAEGLIYPMYEDAIEDAPEEPSQEYCLSCDYGTQNAFAAVLWAKYGNVWYAVDEYYYSGRDEGSQKTDEEYADDLEAFLDKYFGKFETPSGEPMRVPRPMPIIIDPSAASFIEALRRRRDEGLRAYSVIKADNSVADGIRETATAMRRGIIKFAPTLKAWKKEVQGYVWADNTVEDAPIKVNDHCLAGDTQVMTKDGPRAISELVGKTGEVWSYNTQTGQAELKPFKDCRMTQEQAQLFEIEMQDGRTIRCTGDHAILTKRGYVQAQYLTVSDEIIDISDMQKAKRAAENVRQNCVGIKSIRMIGTGPVYNLEVEDNHNFAVNGGLIVHNCQDAVRYFVKTKRLIRRDDKLKNRQLQGVTNENVSGSVQIDQRRRTGAVYTGRNW